MRGRLMLPAAALLLVLLRCLEGGLGAPAVPPRPSAAASRHPPPPPAAPQGARFQAHTAQRLLLWAPGGDASAPGLLYDVQYKRYGKHDWTPVERCRGTARRSCDLTAETREPWARYFARVRAVGPDGPSRWTAPVLFAPREATRQLCNMSLSLSGNTLRVTVDLPLYRGEKSTLAYEDLHPGPWGEYRVYVRRAASDVEDVLLKSSRTFELPELLWGERYCVSVEPSLPSLPTPAKRTAEQCVSTPPRKDSARATVIFSTALLTLVALGTLAVAWVRAYVKKPMETPSVLKSFRRQTSPWSLGVCLEVESLHPLSLGLKTHPHLASRSQASGAARQGTCQMPEALASSGAGSPRLRDLTDSSGCSTDSGICLKDPLGSHTLLLPLLGSSRDRSIQKARGREWEAAAPPASEAEPVGLDTAEALRPAGRSPAQASGYQRQQAGAPAEGLGAPSCQAQSTPVSASGYLKQASVAALPAPEPLALAPEAEQGPSSGSTHHRRLHLLSSVAVGGSEPSPRLPESPKALLASGLLGQDPAWPLPHLSLLHSSARLSQALPWCRG